MIGIGINIEIGSLCKCRSPKSNLTLFFLIIYFGSLVWSSTAYEFTLAKFGRLRLDNVIKIAICIIFCTQIIINTSLLIINLPWFNYAIICLITCDWVKLASIWHFYMVIIASPNIIFYPSLWWIEIGFTMTRQHISVLIIVNLWRLIFNLCFINLPPLPLDAESHK